MKLFLMRHAEAEAKILSDDWSRELTENGINEAEKAADFLLNCQINKILVSNAVRTKQTSEIIQKKLQYNNVEILPDLYASSAEKIIELISQQNDEDKVILVIAHNPGIFKAALTLMDPNSDEYDSLLESGMSTAKIVPLDLPFLTMWKDILNLPPK